MITLRLEGSEELLRKLGGMTRELEAEFQRGVMTTAQNVESRVKNKLKGPVLNVRSGNLSKKWQTKAHGRLAAMVKTDVVYSRIHEFGGVMPPHRVAPRNRKALHWMAGGQNRFSRGHMLPAIRIPERPYARPSVAEEKPHMIERFRRIVQRHIR